ncbi:hypothetical protein [Thalassoglobus sp.]|uniref:hypothetical protein n=1 Tax=Thalassoglobus sp. TaxID=2795869 RepID=UPI003AA9BDD3
MKMLFATRQILQTNSKDALKIWGLILYLFGLVTIAVSAVVMTPVVPAVVTAMMPTVVIVVAVVMTAEVMPAKMMVVVV